MQNATFNDRIRSVQHSTAQHASRREIIQDPSRVLLDPILLLRVMLGPEMGGLECF